MLAAEKISLLKTFLGSLPGHVATRLAAAVELDRLADGAALPHDAILEGLRPTLRSDDIRRRMPTPLRLFCIPFEDLLVDIPRREKQKGRILRAHIVPVWHWVSQVLLRNQAAAYSADVRNAVLSGRFGQALERAERFWPVAGAAMHVALNKDRGAAVAVMGSDLIAEDAVDIATVLQAATAMLDVQALLPKPTPVFNEDLVWGLRWIFEQACASNIDAAPFVSVAGMRRLAKPWEVLKLAALIVRQPDDTLISATDIGLAGEVLFADMEDARDAILATRQPVFDPSHLTQHLMVFTNISSAIVKEMEIQRTGRWGQRLLKDRVAVGNAMDAFMDRAAKEIAGALPMHKAGYSGGPRVPDLSHSIEQDKIDRCLRYAVLLQGVKLLAGPGSFGAKYQAALETACQHVRGYGEHLLKELRSAEGERRTLVEQQFSLTLALTERLFDVSELEFLRRRGKAAGAQGVAG